MTPIDMILLELKFNKILRCSLKTQIQWKKNSATGTQTRVFRVRAEHPNQLDYGGPVNTYFTKHT